MDLKLANNLFEQIKATRLTSLKDDVVELAVRYAKIRLEWLLAGAEKKQLIESDRTTCHNALIAACDILARNMKQQGKDASWRELLGQDRKGIGDFACCLHCLLGLSAR